METVPDSLLNTYIIPAARSDGALPSNPNQAGLLVARLHELAQAKPKPVLPLPPIAKQISRQMYDIEPNSLGITKMSWNFLGEEAWGGVTFGEGAHLQFDLGLDDVYRVTSIRTPGSPTITFYSKGTWVSDDTFILYAMRDGASVQMKIVFKEKGLELNIYPGSGVETVSGTLRPDQQQSE